MEHRTSSIWIVLLSFLVSVSTLQEKAPLQSSLVQVQQQQAPQQQLQQTAVGRRDNTEVSTGSSRGINEHQFKSIGKTGYKYLVAPSSRTLVKPSIHHQNHYFYSDEYKHPCQRFTTEPGPQVPWNGYLQQPYNPLYGWSWGPGFLYFGYSRYSAYPGFPAKSGYLGFPNNSGYPPWFFRESTTDETGQNEFVAQPDIPSRSSTTSYQARVLGSAHIDGKSNSELFPLYQLPNVGRV